MCLETRRSPLVLGEATLASPKLYSAAESLVEAFCQAIRANWQHRKIKRRAIAVVLQQSVGAEQYSDAGLEDVLRSLILLRRGAVVRAAIGQRAIHWVVVDIE